jgi:hypothetical protein
MPGNRRWQNIQLHYSIQSRKRGLHSVEAYKDQKVYSYWMSGFVDTVYEAKCPVNENHIFLKCHVCPSRDQRLRNDPYNRNNRC